MKTVSGAKKRLHRNGAGKLVRYSAGKKHLNTKKTRNRKRNLKRSHLLDSANRRTTQRCMP